MIFNIQRYSTHDGPGIRTVIFIKGCPLTCRWCQNPESQALQQEVMFDPRLCLDACTLCANLCPAAISRVSDSEKHLSIDREKLMQNDYDSLVNYCPTQALTVCGDKAQLDTIMTQILRDRVFYQRSGGGVTLSGGEPFIHPILAGDIFAACKNEGLHTAVESCLHVPWHYIEPSVENIDLFLADLKHVDEKKFYQWTGGSAKRVMNNFRRLAKQNKNVTVRVPLIPDFNADRGAIRQIIEFAVNEVGVNEIHFLPYHTMGINKYALLNRDYRASFTQLDDPELLLFAEEYADSKGITAILRG